MKKATFIVILVIVSISWFVGPASAGTAMNRILQRGELVVGITGNQPPLSATAKDGNVIGLDADIARAISSNMGVKLTFSKMTFAELLPALENGKVDLIISSMTMTLERNLKVAFVGPYYVSGKPATSKTT